MTLEVWRTLDGRVLLHQPGRIHAQAWIEVLPEMVPWLIGQLGGNSYSDSGIPLFPDGPDS